MNEVGEKQVKSFYGSGHDFLFFMNQLLAIVELEKQKKKPHAHFGYLE